MHIMANKERMEFIGNVMGVPKLLRSKQWSRTIIALKFAIQPNDQRYLTNRIALFRSTNTAHMTNTTHRMAMLLLVGCTIKGTSKKCNATILPPYSEVVAKIEARRLEFSIRYSVAGPEEKEIVIDSARAYLLDRFSFDLFPQWYGTAWDFNGMTRTPRKGTIACGYFVTTLLLDAGFRIPRIKWAQLGAEAMIMKTTSRLKRFSNRPVSEVEAYIHSQGDGLYTVGLDNHVGYILKRGDQVRFIHSNYYQRDVGVMSEPLDGHNPLADSNYRIIGTLLEREMMIAWLTGSPLNN